MNEQRAAEIANHCTEDTAGHLSKADLIAAVRFWSMLASTQATEISTLKVSKILSSITKQAKKLEGPSERGVAFAKWFHSQLPSGTKPSDGWETTWAKCYDDMVRLDSRTPEQIAQVCKAARAHGFWSTQFLSPLKLRKRDNAGVMYFDKFAQLTTGPKSQAAVQSGKHYAEPTSALPED